jgi:hypothetical protein
MRQQATSLRKTTLATLKDRLLSVRFNKDTSPTRVNKGGGWDRSSALEFLMEHELNYITGSDDEKRFKFRQKILTRPSGPLEIRDEQLPRGVDLVLVVQT